MIMTKPVDFNYRETKTNEKILFQSLLQLLTSAPCALYVYKDGRETLVGYGTSFDVSTEGRARFLIAAPDGVRAFQRFPDSLVRKGSAVPFTNADRKPNESGALAEVRKGLREIQLATLHARQEAAAQLAELTAARAAVTPPDQITEDGEVIEGDPA